MAWHGWCPLYCGIEENMNCPQCHINHIVKDIVQSHVRNSKSLVCLMHSTTPPSAAPSSSRRRRSIWGIFFIVTLRGLTCGVGSTWAVVVVVLGHVFPPFPVLVIRINRTIEKCTITFQTLNGKEGREITTIHLRIILLLCKFQCDTRCSNDNVLGIIKCRDTGDIQLRRRRAIVHSLLCAHAALPIVVEETTATT